MVAVVATVVVVVAVVVVIVVVVVALVEVVVAVACRAIYRGQSSRMSLMCIMPILVCCWWDQFQ